MPSFKKCMTVCATYTAHLMCACCEVVLDSYDTLDDEHPTSTPSDARQALLQMVKTDGWAFSERDGSVLCKDCYEVEQEEIRVEEEENEEENEEEDEEENEEENEEEYNEEETEED